MAKHDPCLLLCSARFKVVVRDHCVIQKQCVRTQSPVRPEIRNLFLGRNANHIRLELARFSIRNRIESETRVDWVRVQYW